MVCSERLSIDRSSSRRALSFICWRLAAIRMNGACRAATQERTRLSRIYGYGSTGVSKPQVLTAIQTIIIETHTMMAHQLPPNLAMRSANLSPNDRFSSVFIKLFCWKRFRWFVSLLLFIYIHKNSIQIITKSILFAMHSAHKPNSSHELNKDGQCCACKQSCE